MSIWDKYPNYSSDELRTLTAVAAETLIDSAEHAGVTADVLKLSSKSAASQLQPFLQERAPGIQREQVQAALEDPEQSQKIALAVLGEIRQIPPLAERVAEAYEARNREMAGPELLLLAAAVVILAIKVKDVSFSKSGAKASFYEAGEAVKTFVAGLVTSAKHGG
jgi:hypothetical protein